MKAATTTAIAQIEAAASAKGATVSAAYTPTELTNLATVMAWGDHYNNDVRRMVTECYAPSCTVQVKGAFTYTGHETFLALEHGVHRVAPRRFGSAERIIAAGDTVIVQGLLTDPDRGDHWRSPFCAILTFEDGKIVRDESYLDLSQWPSGLLSPRAISTLGLSLERPLSQLAVVALPAIAVRKLAVARRRLQRLA